MPGYCGLDFGTSNSTLGVMVGGRAGLARLEGDSPTLPSALFYDFEQNQTLFGRAAIAEYTAGGEGRLLRALKSVLGTSLIHDATLIQSRKVAFSEILGTFIGQAKQRGEVVAGQALTQVVLGRPVQFVDDDPLADQEAQRQLEAAARAQGFTEVAFQFEPIAAALAYEQQVTREQLALIVDLGGGTADFSVIRVGPEGARKLDRQADILANAGVHIGGTDFDRLLSLARVMPELGYLTPHRNGKQNLPAAPYFDLATWQRINRLYAPKVLQELRQLLPDAVLPERLARLISVIEERQGHRLAGQVEAAKIALTQLPATPINLPCVPPVEISLTQADLNASLVEPIERIVATVRETLVQAGVTAAAIEAVFLTGGSSQVPLVRQEILALFPAAHVVAGDMFGSVGLGLTLDAQRKFG